MKAKEIQELLDFIAKSELDEVRVETSEIKLAVKRNSAQPIRVIESAPAIVAAPTPVIAASSAASTPVAAPAPKVESSNLVTIKSPMIGTFYITPKPGEPAFVEIGSDVKKGQTVCIIEAMKLFNEIESEVNGKIVKVLVENASPVEYDQPLFLVEPN
jgi:acetyl-CoA carboxylase biotin carboxyl carrier protein